ncbi:short-chain dehydrogenase TIC 32, chloroplastic isoform X2 [Folsomia candida]|uniref:short-chain dehydrogenase TIC 32, chloroplastic isoform X2 n=1 Tax=Folsomia candida TaxID=158441 RepID=UPI000B8F719C|nr:short-chain dehydrogenase TIC 32, chloroplastic isoform X2 [Folsomia candida]
MAINTIARGSGARPPSAPGGCCAQLVKFLWSWMGVMFNYALHPSNFYREFCTRPQTFKAPNRSGEVAVLTGGTKGIGLEVLKKLLESKFHVIIGCRSLIAGEEVMTSIRNGGITTGSCKVFELDLKSLKSVRRFAENVLREAPRIDLLINNAGVMFAPYEITEDLCESQFQVNYLSHFVLTNLLLPRMKETSRRSDKHVACRIVNVASDANYGGHIDFDNLEQCKVYVSNKAYSDSKLCQILHAYYLDSLLRSEDIKVNVLSLHPGVIVSDLWNNMPSVVVAIVNMFKWMLRTTEDGAKTVIYTALSPKLEGVGGVYINSCEIVQPVSQVSDISIQKRLWDKSLELGKI